MLRSEFPKVTPLSRHGRSQRTRVTWARLEWARLEWALGRAGAVSVGLAAALGMLLSAVDALGRPGGGQTFGGGSDSSSHRDHSGGGGGSVDGELVWLLIRLVIHYPKVGLPVVVVVLIVAWRMKQKTLGSFTTAHRSPSTNPARPVAQASIDWAPLREADPDFSVIVLEDFCFRLFAAAHRARSASGALEALSPYLSPEVQRSLAEETPRGAAVTAVVVGALRLQALRQRPATGELAAQNELTLEYEANVSSGQGSAEQTHYQTERWVLRRNVDVRTPPPAEAERLGCPHCGAPFSSSDGARCDYCHEVVTGGRFSWHVVGRSVLVKEPRPPALTTTTEERGTELPTVRSAGVDERWAMLTKADPALTVAALQARLSFIYEALNRAWAAGDERPLRPLVSDGLFDYLRYWLEAYRAQGLRNALEQMRLERSELVRVERDKHYDAVTFRFWARGLDFTVRATTGEVVSGSRTRPRAYSEYWTLIRSAASRGPARTEPGCPSCGAQLSVGMAGTCEHCGSHVTRGEFDWVLSKIEQDDVYCG